MTKRQRILLGLGALGLIVVGLGLAALVSIGPRNVIGMLRYDTRREGELKVGDRAPAIDLLALDGTPRALLEKRAQARPQVIVFGSFT